MNRIDSCLDFLEDLWIRLNSNPRTARLIKIGLFLFRLTFRIISLSCAVLAFVLFSGVMFSYFHVCLPLYFDPYSPTGFLHFLWSAWVAFNVWFNYIMCLLTSPGTPDPSLVSPAHIHNLRLAAARGTDTSEWRTWQWCTTCDAPKPPRTHHCHICGRCVLKMDHHCPWIGTCVGHRNHRYFQNFLVYIWLACLQAALEALLFRFGRLRAPYVGPDLAWAVRDVIMFHILVPGIMTIIISGFLIWNTILVVTNQTTLELQSNRMERRGFSGATTEVHPMSSIWDSEKISN